MTPGGTSAHPPGLATNGVRPRPHAAVPSPGTGAPAPAWTMTTSTSPATGPPSAGSTPPAPAPPATSIRLYGSASPTAPGREAVTSDDPDHRRRCHDRGAHQPHRPPGTRPRARLGSVLAPRAAAGPQRRRHRDD